MKLSEILIEAYLNDDTSKVPERYLLIVQKEIDNKYKHRKVKNYKTSSEDKVIKQFYNYVQQHKLYTERTI